MLRCSGWKACCFNLPPRFNTRAIGVRHARVDVALLHRLQLAREKNPLSALTRCGRSPHCSTLIHNRHQQRVVRGRLPDLLRHNQMILADRQRRGVAQREPASLAQKTTVRVAPRNFLQPGFLQPLQPLRNPTQLLLQLARIGDSPPRNRVIWRGMSRLIDIELGFTMGAERAGN